MTVHSIIKEAKDSGSYPELVPLYTSTPHHLVTWGCFLFLQMSSHEFKDGLEFLILSGG